MDLSRSRPYFLCLVAVRSSRNIAHCMYFEKKYEAGLREHTHAMISSYRAMIRCSNAACLPHFPLPDVHFVQCVVLHK